MQASEAKYCLDMHSAIGVTCLRNSPFGLSRPHHWHTLALFLPSCTPPSEGSSPPGNTCSIWARISSMQQDACTATENVGSTNPSQAEQVD